MNLCEHENIKNEIIIKEITSDKKFTGKGKVCADCGAQLWDKQLTEQFNFWLAGLDRVRVQFKISDRASQCLDEFVTTLPGAKRANAARAMITVYAQLIKQNSKFNDIFNEVFESAYYQSFEQDNKSAFLNLDVKPTLFLDIQSWANIFELSTNEFSSEAFHIVMALFITHDEKLVKFWKEKILPQIETILKAG